MTRFVFSLILVLTVYGLTAETVTLRTSYEQLQGKVIGQDPSAITILLSDGSIRSIAKKDIRRIQFQSGPEAAKSDKEFEAVETRLDNEFRQKNPRLPALWRSALIPGLGQLWQQRKIGYGYTGAFLALGAAAIRENDVYVRNRHAYKSSRSLFLLGTPPYTRALGFSQTDFNAYSYFFLGSSKINSARERMQFHANRARNLANATTALYAWILADTIIFAPRGVKVGLYSSPSDGSTGLAFAHSF